VTCPATDRTIQFKRAGVGTAFAHELLAQSPAAPLRMLDRESRHST
jgi:hypothetical protein